MGRRRLQGEQSTVKVLVSLSHNIWMFSVQLPKTNDYLPRMGAALFLVEGISTLNHVGCGRSEHPNTRPGVKRWVKVTRNPQEFLCLHVGIDVVQGARSLLVNQLSL